MKEKIQKIIDERQKIWQKHQDSWDDNIGEYGDYTMEEPEEIDVLGKQIDELLKKHRDELPVDFILESYTMLGQAPQIIYDDNGHWAVTSSGFSSFPMTESGKFEGDESFTAFVEPDMWKSTIREALNHYIEN